MCNRNCTNQIGRRASRSQPSLLGMNITQSEALGDEVFLPPITLERNDPDVTPIDPKVAYVSGDSGQTGYVRPIHFSDYESDQLDSSKETHPPNITDVDPKKSQFTYDTMTGTNVQ
uniref:Uncharacterized protein n=1 Tax=Ciona savignyi TaxID=51511 RepID=H2Y9U7_CIOSA